MSWGEGYIFVIFFTFVFNYLMGEFLPEKRTRNGGQFIPALILAVIAYIIVQRFLG